MCPVDMNVCARFDEIPSITLKDIKTTKHYGRTDNVKTVYPPTNTVCGGITKFGQIIIESIKLIVKKMIRCSAKPHIIFSLTAKIAKSFCNHPGCLLSCSCHTLCLQLHIRKNSYFDHTVCRYSVGFAFIQRHQTSL